MGKKSEKRCTDRNENSGMKTGGFPKMRLKMLALETMFIDHAGAGIIESFSLGSSPMTARHFRSV